MQACIIHILITDYLEKLVFEDICHGVACLVSLPLFSKVYLNSENAAGIEG